MCWVSIVPRPSGQVPNVASGLRLAKHNASVLARSNEHNFKAGDGSPIGDWKDWQPSLLTACTISKDGHHSVEDFLHADLKLHQKDYHLNVSRSVIIKKMVKK